MTILFLLTMAWRAARSGRQWLAGSLIGLAAAIKLFPVILIGNFILRRQLRIAVAGTLAMLLLSATAVSVVGPGAFRDYVTLVLPALKEWLPFAQNASITGFVSRVVPAHAGIAQIATLLTLVVALLRSKRAGLDESFAITTTAALLITPLTWPHSLVILLLPFAIFATSGQVDRTSRWLAIGGFVLMSTPQPFLPGFPGFQRAPLSVNLTVLALNFYGLLALLIALAKVCGSVRLQRERESASVTV